MKERPIESILPVELKEKAREYAKTIEHSYADTREELEEDVAEAWAKGFIFCLQGKVTMIGDEKDKQISKLKKALHDLVYVTKLGKNELATARIVSEAEELLQEIEK